MHDLAIKLFQQMLLNAIMYESLVQSIFRTNRRRKEWQQTHTAKPKGSYHITSSFTFLVFCKFKILIREFGVMGRQLREQFRS